MYAFLIVIHVFVCLVLISVILLQAGRGGGVSDMFGANQTQSVFGTQTNAFMTRATEVCAVVFLVTSLSLGILSTQRGKSLIEREMMKNTLKTYAPPVSGKPMEVSKEAPSPAAGAADKG